MLYYNWADSSKVKGYACVQGCIGKIFNWFDLHNITNANTQTCAHMHTHAHPPPTLLHKYISTASHSQIDHHGYRNVIIVALAHSDDACKATGKSVIAESTTMWFIWQQIGEYESLSDPPTRKKQKTCCLTSLPSKTLFKKNSGQCPM